MRRGETERESSAVSVDWRRPWREERGQIEYRELIGGGATWYIYETKRPIHSAFCRNILSVCVSDDTPDTSLMHHQDISPPLHFTSSLQCLGSSGEQTEPLLQMSRCRELSPENPQVAARSACRRRLLRKNR